MAFEHVFVLILGESTPDPDEVIPCAAMQCPESFTCEEGRVICPFVPPCFTRPTRCVPNDYRSGEASGDSSEEWSGSGQGSSDLSEEWSGSGSGWFIGLSEEWSEWSGSGSGWFIGLSEEWFGWSGSGSGDCPMNMYSVTCGPLCPQDCTNEPTCLALTCTDEERCFCNPGYVLLYKDDPSLGCVLPEECPYAAV
ncbi:hypothetical protein Aduo_016768 [Ancylostoma duodenale]